MKTAVLSILFSASATRTSCLISSFQATGVDSSFRLPFWRLDGNKAAVSSAKWIDNCTFAHESYQSTYSDSFNLSFLALNGSTLSTKYPDALRSVQPCRPHHGSGFSHLNSGTKSKILKWKIDRKQSTWLKNKTAEIERARGVTWPPLLRRLSEWPFSATKESVAPPSESQYCDKRRPSLEPRLATLAANCSDSHYLTSKSPRHRYK